MGAENQKKTKERVYGLRFTVGDRDGGRWVQREEEEKRKRTPATLRGEAKERERKWDRWV